MSHISIIDHPFTAYSPIRLLAEGKRLPPEALPTVIEYADAVALVIPESAIVSPRGSWTSLRGVATSLTGLASQTLTIIQEEIPGYNDKEHEVPAVLFLSMDLISRERAISVPVVGTSEEAEEIAERRNWKTVDDATTELLSMEDRIVTMGAAVLRNEPTLKARFVEDDDNRSFDDTINDIQRRLDLMERPEFSVCFAGVPLATRLKAEAEELCRESAIFRQSREGRLKQQVKLTFWRNVLFTAFIQSVTELQTVLRATLSERRPDLLEGVDAKYWWNLARMASGYRRPKSLTETVEAPAEPVDPTTTPDEVEPS
jgi:hypothetical protein